MDCHSGSANFDAEGLAGPAFWDVSFKGVSVTLLKSRLMKLGVQYFLPDCLGRCKPFFCMCFVRARKRRL